MSIKEIIISNFHMLALTKSLPKANKRLSSSKPQDYEGTRTIHTRHELTNK
jgi:hypothetical protein